MKRNFFVFYIIALGALFIFSCKNDLQKDNVNPDESVDSIGSFDSKDSVRLEKVLKIFKTLPSPIEMAIAFEQSGLTYPEKIMHDYLRAQKYNTTFSQALNLGVYGADMSFAAVFNKPQQSIYYMGASKILAQNLDIAAAVPQEVIEKLERNLGNKDTLNQVVAETYWSVNAYLNDNQRQEVSALVLAAGWIEGMYIGTSIALLRPDKTKEIQDRLAEQKLSFNHLIELLNTFSNDSDIGKILEWLQPVENAYKNIEYVITSTVVTEKNADGIAEIGGTKTLQYTLDDIKQLHEAIKNVRNKIVSL
ncbi:MAG: hypothetical protein KatS3mg034_1241 [Vicingaceae bacterium]|nr:MAG: hypothetical protein KatS3mg034_1241 [Vicingaceae bacterium]